MNCKYILLACILCCFSCRNEKPFVQNENLLGFKSEFLSELDDEKYDSLKVELEESHIDVEYINDIIYISHLRETDACGKYRANIEIINDSIKLEYDLVSDEVCSSLAIKRVTYLINNPKKKKYKIEIIP